MNKKTEIKFSKQISHRFLFESFIFYLLTKLVGNLWNICGKFEGYSYESNLRVHPKTSFLLK